MPRSSKHKSSKHSSRDARDYSDSERDSGLKDRKSKEESAAAKAPKEAEKRRVESKEGEYSDEYGSSKRRKDGGDRWNGGEDDRGEGSKKDSKSRRRDGSVGMYKESREGERKLKDGRSEELVDVDDDEQKPRVPKQVFEHNNGKVT